jgi:transcriptional regulator with XRE-family HTH domain
MDFKISMAAARKNKNYSQTVAAEKIGVSLSTIKNWEKGHSSPKAKFIGKICEVYEIPYDYIFFD